MKPLNNNSEGCNPISSNCVIWQGPEIECIKLCKGDTVSDVVHKLATELCMLMDMTSLSSYDLTCLNVTACNPNNFQGLIQLIIDKLCEALAATAQPSSNRFSTGSDTVVPIAECFYYKTELGDIVTTMTVSNYARAIGTRICDITAQIETINGILVNHENRITVIENTPPPTLVLPQVTPVCVDTPIATPMNVVLSAVEQQFCELRNATGQASQIYNGISAQCVNLNNQPTLSVSGGIMSGLTGWVNNPANVADSITNLWLTICDLRSAVQYIKNNCCPGGCDGIAINMTASFNGSSIIIYLTGTIPSGFYDCDPGGSLFTITDSSGNSISQRISLQAYINVMSGYSIMISPSSLNTASDFNIKADACLTNGSTGSTCRFCIEYYLDNTSSCPAITLSSITDTSVSYSFGASSAPATYTIQLWDGAGTLVISQNVVSVLSIGTQTGVFNGLTASTSYRLRVVITTGATTVECSFVPFTTIPVVCNQPTSVLGQIELPVECPMCGPVVDFASNPSIDGYYIDDTSEYLLLRSGGTFNSIYTDVYQASAPGTVSPATITVRNAASTSSGSTYVAYNDNTLASASILYHYDNTGALVNTITLPFAGAASVRCNWIEYSEFDGKIYFMSWPSALGNPLSVYVLDPSGDSYTKLVGLSAALVGFPGVSANRLNGNLMFFNNLGSIQIGDVNTDTMINTGVTAIPESGLPVVNTNNGEIWVIRNGQNTINIWDVSGAAPVNVGTATAPAGFTARAGSANGTVRSITYYPGDGTIGSDRVFAVFNDAGLTGTYVVEFDANAPYTATTFVTLAYQFSPVNVLYVYSYNKLLLTYGTTLEAFTPTDGTTPYANVTIGAATNLMWPYEDSVNKQIVYFNMASNPTNNVFWIGLDTTNAVACTEGIVNFYQTVLGNNEGPYTWDSATLSWPSACTFIVNNLGTTFSVVATFPGITYQSGILLYSVDNGLTWNPYGGTKTEAEWNAGVIYNKSDVLPYTLFMLRIAILTDNNCGLASKIDTTFN